MKTVHLVVFMMCATTSPQVQAQGLVVTGTVLGSDGMPMKAASVTLYPIRSAMIPLLEMPSLVIATAEAAADGSYRLEADTSGVFQLWFSGVDHATAKTVLLAEPGGRYRVDVTLSAIEISADAKLAVIGPFNEFSPYREYVEMEQTARGTYVARVATDGDTLAYEIIDRGTNPANPLVTNGTGSTAHAYDGRGSYRSLVLAVGDSTLIEYDPRQLPETRSPETVTFRPDSTSPARFARFWSELRENRDAYYARLQAMVDDGADEAEIAGFRNEYDWSVNRLVLAGALREIPDPQHGERS